MSEKHGVYTSEQATGISTPAVADVGIPFIVGLAPIQNAENPAAVGKPVLCNTFSEAVDVLGYSDDWATYPLCMAMYSHFRLFGASPVIFYNYLNPATMNQAVAATDMTVSDHKIELPIEAINDSNIVVKQAGGTGTAWVKDTDYAVYPADGKMVIELLADGAHYSAASANVAYKKVTPASVTTSVVAAAFDNVDLCITTVGMIPDLLLAPGFSQNATVAAAMATKADAINGMFKAIALVDIDPSTVTTATAAVTAKGTNNWTDKRLIPCWPMCKLDTLKFYTSVLVAGCMAKVDTDNGGIPYESPSNKSLKCASTVLASGNEVIVSKADADNLNANGIMTALNFVTGFVAWGNWTAAHPSSGDVKDTIIPERRMFDFVSNTLIKTFWAKLDKPMNRRLIDSILDTANIWLNGLVGAGYLYGARVEMLEDENPVNDLMQGIIRLHVYMTPPAPAKEIDFILEYDPEYVTAAFAG